MSSDASNDLQTDDPDVRSGPSSEKPLRPLVKAWINKITRALKFKTDKFQEDADESLKFYECGKALHELMWNAKEAKAEEFLEDGAEGVPAPLFRVVVGKVAELVQRFGPTIYHQNPTVAVEPKTLQIPDKEMLAIIPPEMIQQAQMAAQQQGQPFDPSSLIPKDPEAAESTLVARIMEYMLNYMQRENDKELHSRRMAEEALIKGWGVLWTEYKVPYPDGPKMIVSTFDTCDNIVFDPDAERREEALWVARRKWLPIWQVSEEWDIDEDFLEKQYGSAESVNSQEEGRDNDNHQDRSRRGKTNDLMEVWYVYSKMGMGAKLSGIQDSLKDVEEYLDSFGDNVMLVLSKKVPYPLNLHHDKIEDVLTEPDEQEQEGKHDQNFMDVQWPIPFWEFGAWPYSDLAFRESPNNPYPMPYIKPAMGHLKFINWAMSFLVNKLRISSTTMISCMKALEEEITQRMLSGKDFRVIPINHELIPDGDISKAVHVFQMPPFQQDSYKVLEMEMDAFDKASGLTGLMYGDQGGFRSAAEFKGKQANGTAPLEDMASRMEKTMALVARKEAMALRWLSKGKDVQAVIGKIGASLWDRFVATRDFASIAREFHYRIEAGSMQRPDKETQQANITQALQGWMPALQFALGHGDVEPINNLWQQWCDALQLKTSGPLLKPPPPPPPNPEMLKVQAEIEGKKQESQIKQQQGQMDLQMTQAKMEMQHKQAEMKMQVDREKAGQDIQLGRLKAHTDLQLQQQEGELKSHQIQQQGHLQEVQAHQQMAQTHQQGQISLAQAQQNMQLKGQQAEIQSKQKPHPGAKT